MSQMMMMVRAFPSALVLCRHRPEGAICEMMQRATYRRLFDWCEMRLQDASRD